MPRYELGDQFREVSLDGHVITTRSGLAPETRERAYEGPARARWEYDRLIALAIEAGYRLVGPPAAPDEVVHAQLAAAILDVRDDPSPYLVYADWLQSIGEPRGELICVQHAIGEHRRFGGTQQEMYFSERALKLERAEVMLLMIHRDRLFGPELSRVRCVDTQRYFIDLFELRWHLGFVRGAALPRSPLRDGVDCRAWRELLSTITARFIRQIHIDWADADELASVGLPRTLERLEIELGAWWPPDREEDTRQADEGYMSLEEVLGSPDHFAGEVIARLAPLLEQPAPALRKLVLQRCPFSGRLLERLVEAPCLAQLDELDLSMGSLSDADVPALRRGALAFEHLESLDLRRNNLGPQGRDLLRDLCRGVKL